MALAAQLGYVLTPLDSMVKELAHALLSRMTPRMGEAVYQSMDFSLPGFSRSTAERMLPPWLKTVDTPSTATWAFASLTDLSDALGPMLLKSDSCTAGATKALKTESERVIRVVATLLPGLTITWSQRSGLDRLYVCGFYLLADEAGEMHPPKAPDRREIGIATAVMTALRRAATHGPAGDGGWGRAAVAGVLDAAGGGGQGGGDSGAAAQRGGTEGGHPGAAGGGAQREAGQGGRFRGGRDRGRE
eukprot:2618011-Prymnesium_polylepis.1